MNIEIKMREAKWDSRYDPEAYPKIGGGTPGLTSAPIIFLHEGKLVCGHFHANDCFYGRIGLDEMVIVSHRDYAHKQVTYWAYVDAHSPQG